MNLNIKKYISSYSSLTIQKRADSIYLTLISTDTNTYNFSYKGSKKTPYKINVSLTKNEISTQCNCPYDYDGLCKHEVAALNFIAKEKATKIISKDLFDNDIVHLKHDEIYCIDHILTQEQIMRLAKKNNIYYLEESYINITDIKKGYVQTIYDGWSVSKQQLTYNEQKQILKVQCTCHQMKKKLCVHVLSSISFVIDSFGEFFFNPNYLDMQKEVFLNNYGLSLSDNYEKFFSFSFGIEGLMLEEKIKNIVSSVDVATQHFLPQLNEKQENLLHISKKTNNSNFQYGIGFCFECYHDNDVNFFNFLPFKAKLKKNSNEFASSFTTIDSYNFIELLKNESKQTKETVLKSLEFDEDYQEFITNFSVEDYRNAFIEFNEFINNASEHSFFIKNQNSSMVKKNLTMVHCSEKKPVLTFKVTENEDFYILKPKLTINERNFQTNSSKIKIFPFFCLFDNVIYKFKTPYEFLYINRLQGRSEIKFFKREYEKLYNEFLNPISKHFEVSSQIHKLSRKKIAQEHLQKQVYLSDYESEFVIFKLCVSYNDTIIPLHSKELLLDNTSQKKIQRNIVFETEFLDEFREFHPNFQEQEPPFFLTPYQLIENQWLLKSSQKMEQKGIKVFGAKKLKSFKFNLSKPIIGINIQSKTDWFDVNIEIKYGNQKVSLKDIKKAVLRKDNYVTLGDGTQGILPQKWLQKFSSYFKFGEVLNDKIKISNYQFNIIDELYEDLDSKPDFLLELQHKKQQLHNLKKVKDIAIPKELKATLRPYQKEGLIWLSFLEENKLGGCLADDMGLGKTLQIIAFVAYLKLIKQLQATHLVVAPTSLIFNWEHEIMKFCPSLKVINYTGVHRKEKKINLLETDIVLTTYGTVLNDIETLKEILFGYIILDESQAIKNPNSKRYKAVRLLKSSNRLTLTGTPIENNTFDLYAQMNFLNPGLLGTMNHFKTTFSNAIDKDKNEETSNLLSKLIHPFLLRRTKKQVATDLPDKSETILYCEMGTEQRKIYELFKEKYRNYLLDKIDKNGLEKSQMYVLEGLTKLRQICNSPELLNDEEDYGKSSIKLDILIDSIKAKISSHKALIFSQFTSMLKLIADRLDNENITYEYLDGKTRKRQEKVNNFQNNDNLRVFLISLKAGGVGLNLTSADYVFLVDPWWNPAVENQAIDRSHRIGQNKHVIAYRMICRNTIEEKIINLQKSKTQVSNSIIQIDNIKKSFNTKEIKELFS